MSAREALARVLHRYMCCEDWEDIAHEPNVSPDYREMADAVLAEWLPTLADDEAVVDGVTRIVCYPALEPSMYLGFTREHLTALATTLSPTSPAPVPTRAAGEHDDRPGSPPPGLGRPSSST